ncbi:Transcriptional regulatory protein ZraR [Pirellulimonas nuda]|uniref:Transcriptional regulatory protein ZraR n=1 Tax=Pirellulimonas nuda TaxID=2528009 RepID=A0A518DJN8_9BACT|nr:sigma 54-interacting transcriptional regulator [Pirellulimonas nuda]QDU91690.1 Transcriptional regulatory protein ZraR [Pirellulimonas nuda]
MYAYLTILSGDRVGVVTTLNGERPVTMGRGGDCDLTLNDRLCSRVHAQVALEEGRWVVRDCESRNGTFVNGQRAESAALGEGHVVRIGTTDLEFHQADQPPTAAGGDPSDTHTLVLDASVESPPAEPESLGAAPSLERVKELTLRHQLAVRLLSTTDPEETVRESLDLLRSRTGASVVGFLWIDDEGKLRPKMVLPEDAAESVRLSPSLTDLVLKRGHAVWVANQEAPQEDSSLAHFSDAVCAPLIARVEGDQKKRLGAVHVYSAAGRFRQSEFDFIISVANLLSVALARAVQFTQMAIDLDRLVKRSPGFAELVGESPPMLSLKSKIAKVAPASGCVLVRGESGVGKELVARAVHRASPRADRPMVSVNCAAIPADLMESQLFGHKSGSFTGADRDHVGYFQQADLGTLFLDEVGELSLEGQAKLLRVLDGRPFLPVGGAKEIAVNVRLVAATNQDLQTYVREKRFREDLYYRLSVFELQVPPLRDRGEDIGLLVDFFLEHFRGEHGRPGLTLSPAAREMLLGYRWPGNVRQLRNVMDSAVVLAEGGVIEPSDLALRDASAPEPSAPAESLRIDHWERKLILTALERTGGAVPEAAKLLGIGRATLYRKFEQHGIER